MNIRQVVESTFANLHGYLALSSADKNLLIHTMNQFHSNPCRNAVYMDGVTDDDYSTIIDPTIRNSQVNFLVISNVHSETIGKFFYGLTENKSFYAKVGLGILSDESLQIIYNHMLVFAANHPPSNAFPGVQIYCAQQVSDHYKAKFAALSNVQHVSIEANKLSATLLKAHIQARYAFLHKLADMKRESENKEKLTDEIIIGLQEGIKSQDEKIRRHEADIQRRQTALEKQTKELNDAGVINRTLFETNKRLIESIKLEQDKMQQDQKKINALENALKDREKALKDKEDELTKSKKATADKEIEIAELTKKYQELSTILDVSRRTIAELRRTGLFSTEAMEIPVVNEEITEVSSGSNDSIDYKLKTHAAKRKHKQDDSGEEKPHHKHKKNQNDHKKPKKRVVAEDDSTAIAFLLNMRSATKIDLEQRSRQMEEKDEDESYSSNGSTKKVRYRLYDMLFKFRDLTLPEQSLKAFIEKQIKSCEGFLAEGAEFVDFTGDKTIALLYYVCFLLCNVHQVKSSSATYMPMSLAIFQYLNNESIKKEGTRETLLFHLTRMLDVIVQVTDRNMWLKHDQIKINDEFYKLNNAVAELKTELAAAETTCQQLSANMLDLQNKNQFLAHTNNSLINSSLIATQAPPPYNLYSTSLMYNPTFFGSVPTQSVSQSYSPPTTAMSSLQLNGGPRQAPAL